MFHSVVYETHEGRAIYPITGFETRGGRLGVMLTDMEGKLVIWQTIHMGMRVMPTEKTTKLPDFKAGPSWSEYRKSEWRIHMKSMGVHIVRRCDRCGRGSWGKGKMCDCPSAHTSPLKGNSLKVIAMRIYNGMEY